jgi:Na+/H+ antiporter NhaD/arsenite permease-like protein
VTDTANAIVSPYAAMSGGEAALHALPFAGLLALVAILPLLPGVSHWWEHLRNKLVVSAVLGLAGVALYVSATHDLVKVGHAYLEYAAFLAMVASLFIVSGGIYITGRFAGFPWMNTAFLALGAVLANLLGTTGASMVLIRPLLRANKLRRHKTHIVLFFIFVVSNCGGLLTALGDPPLYLGFLRGVPFFWTLRFFKEWLVVNGALLAVFHMIDSYWYTREETSTHHGLAEELAAAERPLHIRGKRNFAFLGAILAVLVGSSLVLTPLLTPALGEARAHLGGTLFQVLAMGLIAWASFRQTPANVHAHNEFSFHPILEVGFVFFGIFGAMVPALALLEAKAGALGLTQPWQYFWASGLLSSVLDNAPTYLTFATLAAVYEGVNPERLTELALKYPLLLEAVSVGSVMMGALTYIGNGPNFMVKAIAEHQGVKMPSFVGYMKWSYAVLLPLFLLVTWFFLL